MDIVYDLIESVHVFIPIVAVVLFVIVLYFYGMGQGERQPDEDYLRRLHTEPPNAPLSSQRPPKKTSAKPGSSAKAASPGREEKKRTDQSSVVQHVSQHSSSLNEKDAGLSTVRQRKSKGQKKTKNEVENANKEAADDHLTEDQDDGWVTVTPKRNRKSKMGPSETEEEEEESPTADNKRGLQQQQQPTSEPRTELLHQQLGENGDEVEQVEKEQVQQQQVEEKVGTSQESSANEMDRSASAADDNTADSKELQAEFSLASADDGAEEEAAAKEVPLRPSTEELELEIVEKSSPPSCETERSRAAVIMLAAEVGVEATEVQEAADEQPATDDDEVEEKEKKKKKKSKRKAKQAKGLSNGLPPSTDDAYDVDDDNLETVTGAAVEAESQWTVPSQQRKRRPVRRE